ncbi:ankyrin repeat domain-containing protein [bacterium]|nr:MAG: ankyrin repeat domain-containing protein [bacterium]
MKKKSLVSFLIALALATNAMSAAETPLHKAARDGDIAQVRILIESKANVDAQDNYGWTPL